jgi:tetratricopeptide (TPR) repeat protein
MRPLALLVCVAGCAEWRMPATFPEQAAGRPVVHEQALLGLSDDGTAAVAEMLDADGEPPRLTLLAFAPGGPARKLLSAASDRAAMVARKLSESGHELEPVLALLVAQDWPDAPAEAARLGYRAQPPADPDPGRPLWRVSGVEGAGALPLLLQLVRTDGPAAVSLSLSDRAGSDAIELARMPLTGREVLPRLWLRGGVVWLLSGSVSAGDPLRRTVGLRGASIRRGEAQLHNGHGLADYGAGELDAARREFDRAISADPGYVDALYNAAAVAALTDRAEDAVALLGRAAAIDPGRVQVMGRNDADFKALRRRADVRALLGLRRLPPEDVPPPP